MDVLCEIVRGCAFDVSHLVRAAIGRRGEHLSSLRRITRLGAAALFFLLATMCYDPCHVGAQLPGRVVAQSSQLAAGASGAAFVGFFAPNVTALGTTTFFASLDISRDPPSSGAANGIWSEVTGSLQPIVIENFTMADPVGAKMRILENFTINVQGRSVFTGRLQLSGSVTADSDEGIWSTISGSAAVLAREGVPAPGTFSNFAHFGTFGVDASGNTAFVAQVDGGAGGFGTGIWSTSNPTSTLTLIAHNGTTAPGAGTSFSSFVATLPGVNREGYIVFAARLNALSSDDDSGIWAHDGSGTLQLVIRENSTAPGTSGPGIGLASFDDCLAPTVGSSPVINLANSVAFGAALKQTPSEVTDSNDSGIWRQTSGTLALVAREGSAAPATTDTFADLRNAPLVLNDSGKIAFLASLQTGAGIWTDATGALSLVVRDGGSAPQINGASFSGFAPPAINGFGELAFLAGTQDGGQGIWAHDSDRSLTLVARTGEVVQFGPSDTRTITALAFAGGTGNETGFSTGWNDCGNVAFLAAFDDGSVAMFVSTVPVPGDANFDGIVNIFDINMISSNWSGSGPAGDVNHDGTVNIFDINIVSSHWNETARCDNASTSSAHLVPEPPTSILAAFSLFGFALGKRRWPGKTAFRQES